MNYYLLIIFKKINLLKMRMMKIYIKMKEIDAKYKKLKI